MKFKITLVIVWALIACSGCLTNEPPSKEWLAAEKEETQLRYFYTNGMSWPRITGPTETVMTPGMRIRAATTNSEIEIVAGQGYKRSYTWDGATRSVVLWPRNERWYGSLGIYFPGPGEHWKSNKGITRGVLDEGVLWFDEEKTALHYIQKVEALTNCVYTHDGLVVAWEKVLPRKQINVDVWQLMIAGSKPTNLPYSRDNQIQIKWELP